jgi:hypothetical protein
VFFHRLGEIRDQTLENQRYQASGLNLAVAAVILCPTVYLSDAVAEMRSNGERVREDLLASVCRSATSQGFDRDIKTQRFEQDVLPTPG